MKQNFQQNKFGRLLDIQKIASDIPKKIGVKESNGDIISGVRSHVPAA
jgi:hypothetical protein